MQPIASIIKSTYFERYDEMPLDYRLHYASRLAAWELNADATAKLAQIKDEVVPKTHDERWNTIASIREELKVKDYERDVNDYARRKPFFEKYPDLLLLHNTLFRLRHWFCIYDIDERALLYDLLPKEKIHALLTELQADTEAKSILSTYFINTIYLYTNLYPESGFGSFDPLDVLNLAAQYDTSLESDTRLLIYLFTHCILGETLFYYQPITRHIDTYKKMLAVLETTIEAQYDSISLDNKCEFLVCAQICSFPTKLTDRINEEAAKSLNQDGYIVDVFNTALNPKKQSFVMSEHRNVLYIMAQSRPAFL